MSVSGAVKLRTSGGYQKRVAKVEIGRNTSNWWGAGDVFLFFRWRGCGSPWLPELKDAPD